MAYEFEMEAQTDLPSGGSFKVKIKSDSTVVIDILDTVHMPICHLIWTVDDLRKVNLANRPLLESYLNLHGTLGVV